VADPLVLGVAVPLAFEVGEVLAFEVAEALAFGVGIGVALKVESFERSELWVFNFFPLELYVTHVIEVIGSVTPLLARSIAATLLGCNLRVDPYVVPFLVISASLK